MPERAENLERKPRPETLRLEIDPESLGSLREKAEALGVDVETLARWGLFAGLFLFDLDAFIHSGRGVEI